MGWFGNAVKPGDVDLIDVDGQAVLEGTNPRHLLHLLLLYGTEFNRRGALN